MNLGTIITFAIIIGIGVLLIRLGFFFAQAETVFGITLWKNKITKIAKIIIGGVFIVYGLTIVFNLIVDPTEHTHEINEDVSDEFRSMVKTYLTGEFIFLSDYDYKSMIITWKGNSIVVRTPGRMLWLFYRGSGSQQNIMNWTVDPLEIN